MIHFCQQQPAIVSKIKCDNLSLQWAQLKHKKASSSHSFHFHYSQSAILSSFAQTFTISLTYINIFLNCTPCSNLCHMLNYESARKKIVGEHVREMGMLWMYIKINLFNGNEIWVPPLATFCF